MKNRKKGFTLIELIAVLVIMAILALIVTPLVMSIIRKAKVSADKRSIDAYGRSIELAIASYLLDTGSFPTDVSDLTIEYSGSEVVCSTTQLNSDSSVYLTGCTVAGRSVDYAYGTDKTPPAPTYEAYSVGDSVTYNDVNYYVIENSGTTESTVKLLKAEPLTVSEVNQYGAGHINKYPEGPVGTASDVNGYGGMAYYSSETCGYVNNDYVDSGCTTDYADSDVKYVVDAWKTAKAPAATEARLITINDLVSLGVEEGCVEEDSCWVTDDVPTWLYESNGEVYWTMIPLKGSSSDVRVIMDAGDAGVIDYVPNYYLAPVRPVVVLPKSAISS